MVFKIASSPFTHNQRSTARIMMLVCLAALPGIAMQWYWFGWGTLIQVVLGIVSAMAAEALVLRLRKKSVQNHLADNSALLTGLLLGISIPPLAPWWMVVVGMVFAIIIAKQLYGGLGNNPFNPAMIGYVVLLIAFPVQMTSWLPPQSIAANVPGFVDSLAGDFPRRNRYGRNHGYAAHGRGRHQPGHAAGHLQNRPACGALRGATSECANLWRRAGGPRLAVG